MIKVTLPSFEVDEKRLALSSVQRLPLPDAFEAAADQPVRGTFVGHVKGIRPRRDGETWTLTYEVSVVEVEITPLPATPEVSDL